MANKKKFEAPQTSPYGSLIQSTGETPEPVARPDFYRFNAKMPIECKDYLQEMAWRNRTTITDYLTRLVMADMKQHPDWRDTLDILNR